MTGWVDVPEPPRELRPIAAVTLLRVMTLIESAQSCSVEVLTG
jgi:hypothetical protein